MSYRNGVQRDNDDKGIGEMDRARSVRRGRSATPSTTTLWEEYRRLYMDNLRLWDCLTLIRGDPNMACSEAIRLVFGLSDDEYLRMFPDTKQLLMIMFPCGTIYHTSVEAARLENARLKDENARLHAAVWVLRDNPSLQADSTVAAIFRLSEAQFLSKFKTDLSSFAMGQASTLGKNQYQNNNKEQKKSYQTSLDFGNEPAMAIHLTNKPLRNQYNANDGPVVNKCNKRYRSQSLVRPKHQQNVGPGFMNHCDFTSNWKQTSPLADDSASDQLSTDFESPSNSDSAVLSWSQSDLYQPVATYNLEASQYKRENDRSRPPKKYLQNKDGSCRGLRNRKFRRSNSVSKGGDILAEGNSKGRPHGAPVKCVSFAEPLPSNQIGSSVAPEVMSFRDNIKVIFDTKSIQSYCPPSRAGDSLSSHESVDDDDDDDDDDDGGEWHNVENSPEKYNDIDYDAYNRVSTREPSKKYQKDTATSPVLDTRTCFFILSETHKTVRQNSRSKPNTLKEANTCAFDNNNNSESASLGELTPSKTNLCRISNKSKIVRPLSPKHRDFRQTRMKNMLACEKLNSTQKPKLKNNGLPTCSSNNALFSKKHCGKFPRVSAELDASKHELMEPEIKATKDLAENLTNEEMDEKQDSDVEDDIIQHITNKLYLNKTVADAKPAIFYSQDPAPTKAARHAPYNVRSYTTVKHFLDRHSCVESEQKFCTHIETIATERNSSQTRISRETMSSREIKSLRSSHKGEENAGSEFPSYGSHVLPESYSFRYPSIVHTPKRKCTKPAEFSDLLDARAYYPKFCYNKPGQLKIVDASTICKQELKLQELKKLGNFKFTKPLTEMIKRNGLCDHKTIADEKPGSRKTTITSTNTTQVQQPMLNPSIAGPFLTFTSKQ